jgi:PKD repeat protein
MFLDGTQLYFSDQNGALKRLSFNRGVITGTATTVNTQIDWRARGMAVLTSAGEPPPNQDPTAAFTSQCFGLSCQFDASTSSDVDGSIVTYAWDFGDGTQSSSKTVNHAYDTAGTYTVTLTVTDNRSGTDTTSTDITVEPQVTNLAFRDANSVGGAASARPTVQIPASVQPGDTLLLFVTNGASRTAQPPTGWTLLDQRQDVELRSEVFWRTAVPGDAGSSVQVPLASATGDVLSAANTVTLAAYSGAGAPSSITYEAGVETSTSVVTNHRTPDATVPLAGSLVVSYWSDRTSNTTTTNVTSAWTPPAGEALRAAAYNSATGGRVTSLLTDGGATVDAGPRPGLTAAANGQTTKATMWTIVLPPGA